LHAPKPLGEPTLPALWLWVDTNTNADYTQVGWRPLQREDGISYRIESRIIRTVASVKQFHGVSASGFDRMSFKERICRTRAPYSVSNGAAEARLECCMSAVGLLNAAFKYHWFLEVPARSDDSNSRLDIGEGAPFENDFC